MNAPIMSVKIEFPEIMKMRITESIEIETPTTLKKVKDIVFSRYIHNLPMNYFTSSSALKSAKYTRSDQIALLDSNNRLIPNDEALSAMLKVSRDFFVDLR